MQNQNLEHAEALLERADTDLRAASLILQRDVATAVTSGLEGCGHVQDEERAIFDLVVQTRARLARLAQYIQFNRV